LTFQRGRELELADTFPTYAIHTCSEQMTQVVKFAKQSADDVSAYSEILATIEERCAGFQENFNDETVTMPISKIASVVYRWSAEPGN